MTAATWTADEVDRIGAAEELEIAPRWRDGMLLRSAPIWVVRVGEGLRVGSWRGSEGAWLRAAQRHRSGRISAGGVEKDVAFADAAPDACGAVDAADREQYARYPRCMPSILSDRARATTFKLVPANGADGA